MTCYSMAIMATIRGVIEQFFSQFETGYEPLNSIELSQSALLHNYDYLKKIFRADHVIPVLKCNAYGHGYEILKILEARDLTLVAVDGYDEALEVRALSDFDVLVMGGILPENYIKVDTKHVIFVIQDMSVLNVLTNLRRDIKIHIEFDTGMNRQGFDVSETKEVIRTLKENTHIELNGLMSHLYNSIGKNQKSTKDQMQQFDEIVAQFKKAGFNPEYIHLSKTSGVTDASSKYVNAIRPGIGLYGINPLDDDHLFYEHLEVLQPVMAAYTRVVKTRHIKSGEGVSYNHTFKAKKDMDIAVLPFGYGDGLSEQLSNSGFLRYKKQALPIIGQVCMNHTMLDITGTNVKMWDRIEVISRERDAPNSIRRLKIDHGFNPHVMLTRISSEIRRKIVD